MTSFTQTHRRDSDKTSALRLQGRSGSRTMTTHCGASTPLNALQSEAMASRSRLLATQPQMHRHGRSSRPRSEQAAPAKAVGEVPHEIGRCEGRGPPVVAARFRRRERTSRLARADTPACGVYVRDHLLRPNSATSADRNTVRETGLKAERPSRGSVFVAPRQER